MVMGSVPANAKVAEGATEAIPGVFLSVVVNRYPGEPVGWIVGDLVAALRRPVHNSCHDLPT